MKIIIKKVGRYIEIYNTKKSLIGMARDEDDLRNLMQRNNWTAE